jgi:hypothetical protein
MWSRCIECGGWACIYTPYLLACSAINVISYFGDGSGLKHILLLCSTGPIWGKTHLMLGRRWGRMCQYVCRRTVMEHWSWTIVRAVCVEPLMHVVYELSIGSTWTYVINYPWLLDLVVVVVVVVVVDVVEVVQV